MFIKKILSLFLIIVSTFYITSNVANTKEDNKRLKSFFENKINVGETRQIKAESYIAVLEIPKIGLKRGLFPVDNPLNTVEKNVEINPKSDMPDIASGNFILEAHSGYSFVSFFNNLENLTKDDQVIVYYDNVKYFYNINYFYNIPKNGQARIKRDETKNTITLITCKKNNKDKQIIYIGYFIKKEPF